MNKKNNSPAESSESAEWAERLAKARAQRELMKDSQNQDDEDTKKFFQTKIGESTISVDNKQVSDLEEIVSVDDVLQTANLNDRMEMARLRHVQILALRGTRSGDMAAISAEKAPIKHKNTFRAAIGKKPAEPKQPTKELSGKANGPSILNAHEAASPGKKMKRPLAIILLSGGVLALLFAAFLPGQGRDLVTGLLGQVTGKGETILQTESVPNGTSNVDVENVNDFYDSVVPVAPMLLQALTDIKTRNSDLLLPSDLSSPNTKVNKYSRLLKLGPDAAPVDLIGLNAPEYAPNNKEVLTAVFEPDSYSIDAGTSIVSAPNVTDSLNSPFSSILTLGIPNVAIARNFDPQLQLSELAVQIVNISNGTAIPIIVTDREILKIGDVNIVVAQPVVINELPAGSRVDITNSVDSYKGVEPTGLLNPKSPAADVDFASLPPLPELAPAAKPQLIISNLQINSPSNLSDDTINGVIAAFVDAGFSVKASRKVEFNIRNTNVRFFHPQDREAAQLVSDAIGGIARDFTDFRPSPPFGTVEVWLAGDAAARPGARRQGVQSGPRSTRQEDPALIQLRNRLVESLKRGDHL